MIHRPPAARTGAQSAATVVRTARALKSGVAVSAPCSAAGRCRVSVRLRHGGHVRGKARRMRLIAGSRNRIVIHLRRRERLLLLDGDKLRRAISAQVAQRSHVAKRARVTTVGL
ncbi:MAG: hypothetical protein EXQ70_09795 [Solirubrobacterales bacterium]|nr:hypothetical protein [Solirubrobacterales bacterium]